MLFLKHKRQLGTVASTAHLVSAVTGLKPETTPFWIHLKN